MVNVTLSFPEELYKEMREHPELKWSEVARQAVEKKLKELKLIEEILVRNKMTEEAAERIGHKLKGEIRKRFD